MKVTAEAMRGLYGKGSEEAVKYIAAIGGEISSNERKIMEKVIMEALNDSCITFHTNYWYKINPLTGRVHPYPIYEEMGDLTEPFISFLIVCGFEVLITTTKFKGGNIYSISWGKAEKVKSA